MKSFSHMGLRRPLVVCIVGVIATFVVVAASAASYTNIGPASGPQELNVFEVDITLASPSAMGRVYSSGQLDGFTEDLAVSYNTYLNASMECIGGSVFMKCNFTAMYEAKGSSLIRCGTVCTIPAGRSVLNVFYSINALSDAVTTSKTGAFAPILLAAQNSIATRFDLDTTALSLTSISLTAPCRSSNSFSPAASANRCEGEAPLTVPLPSNEYRITSTVQFMVLLPATSLGAATIKSYVCEMLSLTPTVSNVYCLNNVSVTGQTFNSALVTSLIDAAIVRGASSTESNITLSSSVLEDGPFAIGEYPSTQSFLVTVTGQNQPTTAALRIANHIRAQLTTTTTAPPVADYVLLFPYMIRGGTSTTNAATFTVLYDADSESPTYLPSTIECGVTEYLWVIITPIVILPFTYIIYRWVYHRGKKKGARKGVEAIKKREAEEMEEMAESQQHMSASQVFRNGAANTLTPEQMQQMQMQMQQQPPQQQPMQFSAYNPNSNWNNNINNNVNNMVMTPGMTPPGGMDPRFQQQYQFSPGANQQQQ